MSDKLTLPLGKQEIMNIIPHRPPFLLVDRIIELEPGKKIVGEKTFFSQEEFFKGHFPRVPIVPGVLLLEALLQTGAVGILSLEKNKGKIAFVFGIDKVKIRKPVRPNEKLRLEVEIKGDQRGKGIGKVFVNGELVIEAEFNFVVREPTV